MFVPKGLRLVFVFSVLIDIVLNCDSACLANASSLSYTCIYYNEHASISSASTIKDNSRYLS